MTINVPKNIEIEFMNLLDIAQASVTEEEFKSLSAKEQRCLKFVEKLLGSNASRRFKSRTEGRNAAKNFAAVVNEWGVK